MLKKIVAFLLGLLLMFLAYAATIIILFYLSHSGFDGKDLTDADRESAMNFYAFLALLFLNAIAVLLLLRRKWQYASAGMALPALIGFIFLSSMGPRYFKQFERMPFNQKIWQSSDETPWGEEMKPRPLAMARTIAEGDLLKGKSRADVEEILGKGRTSEMVDDDNMLFWVINRTWHLRIVFKNDTVQYAYIWMPGMYF